MRNVEGLDSLMKLLSESSSVGIGGTSVTEEVWVPKTVDPVVKQAEAKPGTITEVITTARRGWIERFFKVAGERRALEPESVSTVDDLAFVGMGWVYVTRIFRLGTGDSVTRGYVTLQMDSLTSKSLSIGLAYDSYSHPGEDRKASGTVSVRFETQDGANVSKTFYFDDFTTADELAEAVKGFIP